MNNDINSNKKEPPTIVKILIIALIIIGILMTVHAFSETRKDTEAYTRKGQEIKENLTAVTFNCPYCKAYNSIKQKDLHEIVQCHNCKKWLTINSDGTVTINKYIN